jgi:hypothetical protein
MLLHAYYLNLEAYKAPREDFYALEDFELDEGQTIACNADTVYAYLAETVIVSGDLITQEPSYNSNYHVAYDYYAIPCYDSNGDKRIIVARFSDKNFAANVFNRFKAHIEEQESESPPLEFAGAVAPLDEGIETFAVKALTRWGAIANEREFDRFFLPVQLNVGKDRPPDKATFVVGIMILILGAGMFVYNLSMGVKNLKNLKQDENANNENDENDEKTAR